jgi:hypothetical protein
MRLNLKQAIDQLLPYINNGGCDRDAARDVINDACDRLIDSGKWVGSIRKIAFCHKAGVITLPPEVGSVLGFSDCNTPVSVHNSWYEYLPGGPGQLNDCRHANVLVERGDGYPCAFDVTKGYKVRLYNDWPQDDGKAVLIQGINRDGNRVQTEADGEVVDGEILIANASTPPTGTVEWGEGGIKVVQKEITEGPLRLYQVDPVTGENAGLLAVWGPNEEFPSYRRYFYGACQGYVDCEGSKQPRYRPLTFLCKIRHVPLVRDTDMVPITASGALKNMVQAIWLEKVYRPQEAAIYEQRAIQCLMNELKQHQGSIQVLKSSVPGFGNRAPVYSFR